MFFEIGNKVYSPASCDHQEVGWIFYLPDWRFASPAGIVLN